MVLLVGTLLLFKKARVVIASLVVGISIFSCNGVGNGIKVEIIDTSANNFLIANGSVGSIAIGSSVRHLGEIYGEHNVKLLQLDDDDETHVVDTLSVISNYYVYGEDSKLLFVAIAKGAEEEKYPAIWRIRIVDDRYHTSKGISLHSTVGDIAKNYPDVNIIQGKRGVFLYVPSADSYMQIDTVAIRGYDSRFTSGILLDSINSDAKVLSLAVSCEVSSSDMLSSRFWEDIMRNVLTWVIVKLPSLLIIIAIFAMLLRLLKFTVTRVEVIAKRRAQNDTLRDPVETVKRITTLAGIIKGAGVILLWALFLLTFLSKIDIDITPILTSAGILGLAIGFGAQELVRDFISGFFMLLEDQLRTGDMAIINDTQGVVEKIELRTVTLRDAAGVVHIFQNGKINTLSNMTKEWSAIVLEIGVAYKENIDSVMEVMQRVGDEMTKDEKFGPNMLETVKILGLDQFGDSAIVIKLIIKSRPMQQWDLKREYNRRLKIEFDKLGIEMPFPHISLYTGEECKPMPVEITQK